MIKQSNNEISNPSITRIAQLDSIRGIAILLVVVWHYFISMMPESTPILYLIKRILSLSWSGVDLFFVLSGFLIGSILIEYKISNNYYKVFYIRRACRILPLYYLMVAIYFVVISNKLFASQVFNFLFYYDNLPLFGYLTYTQNFFMLGKGTLGPKLLDVTWSLAVEEQFYLILPLFIRFVPNNKLPFYIIILIFLAPFLRMVTILSKVGMESFLLLPLRIDSLLIGVLASYLVRNKAVLLFFKKNLWSLYVTFLVITISLIALTILSPINLLYTVLSATIFSFLAFVYVLLLLIFILSENRFIKKIAHNKFLMNVGIISYAIYLFHNPMQWLCHAFLLNQTPRLNNYYDIFATIVALLFTFGLSWISYTYFELIFIRLGHKFKW